VWVNDEKQDYGYVVNEVDGRPTVFVPMDPDAYLRGQNNFELRVPITGQTVQIERLEIVQSDDPEELNYNSGTEVERFPNAPGAN
jgi:hypothetical protein